MTSDMTRGFSGTCSASVRVPSRSHLSFTYDRPLVPHAQQIRLLQDDRRRFSSRGVSTRCAVPQEYLQAAGSIGCPRMYSGFPTGMLADCALSCTQLPGAPDKNPIVAATFTGTKRAVDSTKKRKRVLCYGHYDVIPAEDRQKWSMNPFEMLGRNGWIMGRGVSDNKVGRSIFALQVSHRRR